MMAWVLANEPMLRLGCFLAVFALMASWEALKPCRIRRYSRWFRWSNNLGLVVLNSVLVRLLFPIAAVGMAQYAAEQGIGLFNWLQLPVAISLILAVVLLDLAIYLQHVVFHKVPWFWALHKVHHADPDYDVTTGARFHPVEIVLSLLIKMVVVVVLGAPAVAVIIFEVILNASAMFNHANVQLPRRIDQWLRRVLVTPDMHRVHHSVIRSETDSNYGFALSWWDRLFATYKQAPQAGQQGMDIGQSNLRDPKQICRLDGLLTLPLKR